MTVAVQHLKIETNATRFDGKAVSRWRMSPDFHPCSNNRLRQLVDEPVEIVGIALQERLGSGGAETPAALQDSVADIFVAHRQHAGQVGLVARSEHLGGK